LHRHALVAAREAPFADQDRDPQRAFRWIALILCLGGCHDISSLASSLHKADGGSAPAPAPPPVPETPPLKVTATATLSQGNLRRHVAYLASDELEGRGASTQGIRKAANYLERELEKLGLQPLFAKSWRQPFPITVGARIGEDCKLVQAGPNKFRIGKDFVPY